VTNTIVDVIHTPKSSAEYTHRHPKTVLKALRRGELIGYQPGGAGCAWRIYQSDLDRWVRGERPEAKKTRRAR
jgi:excisionase family DNA binding protein